MGRPLPPPASANTQQYAPAGASGYACGGTVDYKKGGMIPGHAQVPGDSQKNDTVPIKVSPGEAVLPRTTVQQNPATVQQLLAQHQGGVPQHGQVQLPAPDHHPQDVAALLAAMKHLRGQNAPPQR